MRLSGKTCDSLTCQRGLKQISYIKTWVQSEDGVLMAERQMEKAEVKRATRLPNDVINNAAARPFI